SGITYSINGTTYQSSAVFSGVAPGTYSVTARNSGGTSAATTVTVNAQPVAPPSAPTVSVSQPTIEVATGTITVTAPVASGITYSINGTTYQSSAVFSGVAPGTYSVTARNSGGTSAATTVTVNAQPVAPKQYQIDLLNFNGIQKDDEHVLTWETKKEINSSHFIVEHSSDGFNFDVIGEVAAAGNSSDKKSYSFTYKPNSSMNYYRLRLVTDDGKFTLSKTVTVKLKRREENALIILGNPVQNQLVFQTTGKERATIQIVDETGKILITDYLQLSGRTNGTIDVSYLSNGVYYLVVNKLTERLSTKFVKQ
ncbi:MAG: T9SS type A sorting domain-containing protein, partial [Bacteroidota bacterium]|nr:T9SS type A sorting domain-containing protein [Bacteroidota bacterium]